jgi:hypothetical protein
MRRAGLLASLSFPVLKAEHDYGVVGECDTRMLVIVGFGSRIIQFDDFSYCNRLSRARRYQSIKAKGCPILDTTS